MAHGLRDRVRRAARAAPHLSAAALAERVGCHPSTVDRWLPYAAATAAASRPTRPASLPLTELQDRALAARRTVTAPRLLGRLAGYPDPETRRGAADNPNSPRLRLALAGLDHNPKIRKAVASNPGCPQATLAALSVDPVDWVADQAAANPRCPAAAVLAASYAQQTLRRASAAANLHCPPGQLARLADDDEILVRTAVAKHNKTPQDVLRRLADDDTLVRSGVALNYSTPHDALRRLAADDDHNIAWQASHTLRAIEKQAAAARAT